MLQDQSIPQLFPYKLRVSHFSYISKMHKLAAFVNTGFTCRTPLKTPWIPESAAPKHKCRHRFARTTLCAIDGQPDSKTSIGRELLGRNATWTQKKFDEWLSMRTGSDPAVPVYWYAIGDVFSAPRGARELVIEGVDVAKTQRLSATKALQLSRKIFVFRDVETNQIVTEHQGKGISPLQYDYQAITYSLEDGRLIAETTMGKGDSIVQLRGDRFYWRDVGDGYAICSPLFTERGWIENYDFYGGGPGGYKVSWHGAGPSSLVETGQVVMEMSGVRLHTFEEIPDTLRNYILEEAPLWRKPPASMDEIEQLQKA